MIRFWNWVKNENKERRELFLYGEIAPETWWGDEVTPQLFREELYAENGPVVVWINSPGGDCFAASQIYTMLAEYPSDVTVQIDGIAASAASVIAMAGNNVRMAPTAVMMVHNPLTCVAGNSDDMQKAIEMLSEVKESIINAYEIKTGLARDRLSVLMDNETWMNAKKALELGFCDEIIVSERANAEDIASYAISAKTGMKSLVDKVMAKIAEDKTERKEPCVSITTRERRLSLLK